MGVATRPDDTEDRPGLQNPTWPEADRSGQERTRADTSGQERRGADRSGQIRSVCPKAASLQDVPAPLGLIQRS